MEGDAIRRWVRRHPEGARLLAAFRANDAALQAVIDEVRRERPEATAADVVRHIVRIQRGG